MEQRLKVVKVAEPRPSEGFLGETWEEWEVGFPDGFVQRIKFQRVATAPAPDSVLAGELETAAIEGRLPPRGSAEKFLPQEVRRFRGF